MSRKDVRTGNGTRAAIIEAALRKFSEKSFIGATTAEIAVEAGVSEKTIFDLFGNKKTLYLAVRDSIRNSIVQTVIPRLPLGAGAPNLLRTLGRLSLDEFRKHRDELTVTFHAITAINDPEIRKSNQEAFLGIHLLVRNILAEGRKSGLVNEKLDLEQFAWTFMMALYSIAFVEVAEFRSPLSDETALLFIDHLVDIIEPD